MFVWEDARIAELFADILVEKMFLQALEQTGKTLIILNGFDKISPHFT
jgi:hypothetical protein